MTIPIRDCDSDTISAEQFRDEYFRAGVPVLLRGFLRAWPLCRALSPADLAARFGDVIVDVMRTRTLDGHGDGSPYLGVRSMTLAEFVETLGQGSGSDQDLYLVAHNQLLRRDELAPVLNAMTFDPRWFDDGTKKTHVSLWMGPPGAVTPLHFDLQNTLLVQAWGRKRVMLAAPAETPHLYQGMDWIRASRPRAAGPCHLSTLSASNAGAGHTRT